MLEDAFRGRFWGCLTQPPAGGWGKIGSKQILFALVAQEEGVAACVFRDLGIEIERAAVAWRTIEAPTLVQYAMPQLPPP